MSVATHYGIHVASLDDACERLGRLGFTSIEVDGPRRYSMADPVGKAIGWAFGDVFAAEVIEAPWGQQIELVETTPAYRVERPSAGAVQGDTTVVIPVPDLLAASEILALVDPQLVPGGLGGTAFGGQRLVLTRGPSPWAVVHYAPSGWDRASHFITDALGLRVVPLGDGRFLLADGGARLEARVSADTGVAHPELGKRYVGTGHVAVTGIDMDRLIARLPDHQGAVALQSLGPRGGVLHGPANDGWEVHSARDR